MTSIVDAEDCWEIVCGIEIKVTCAPDANIAPVSQPAVYVRQAGIKDFQKHAKKAASLVI